MPTYEYKCEACDHKFDLVQSITAGAIRKCPECGRLKVRRLISGGGGIIFRGSGFYATDYRSESYKQSASKDKSPAVAGASSSSSDKAGSSDKSSSSEKGGAAEKAPAAPAAPATASSSGKAGKSNDASGRAAQ